MNRARLNNWNGAVVARATLAVLLVGAVLLSSCTKSDLTLPQPSPSLVDERKAAGIPDCPATDASASAIDKGLPTVSLECLGGGQQVNLADLSRGTPTVINLWAQWCRPCRLEAPFFAAASKRLAGKVQFIGVNHSDPQPESAIAFAAAAGWRYPQLQDPEGLLKKPPMKVVGLPYTFFVDAKGIIVHVEPGVIETQQSLDELITRYLSG